MKAARRKQEIAGTESEVARNQARYQEALRRGNVFNEKQQWKQAFKAFRIALAEDPQSAEAYAGLGEACFGLKMLDKALDSYKLAARVSRGDFHYLQRVTDLQERLGQLGDAARTYLATGELLLRQRQLDEAIYNWERAVRLDPSLLGAHRRLAMVFQRQHNTKAAVREYLAIARILQMRGEQHKALQMCQAALRLDPENEDVRMAMELVLHGEKALRDEEEEAAAAVAEPELTPEDEEREEMAATVRQIATVFEQERQSWQQEQQPARLDDPVTIALQRAQDELTEEIFRDEEDEDERYSERYGMSKLERDALIGQGIDFQSRGEVANAVACYEKALAGGLRLPAAYFSLGLLYLEQSQLRKARAAFARAGQVTSYRPAIRVALARSQ